MSASPKSPKAWFPEVAEKVARNNLSLRQAAQELGIALSIEECDKISKQKAWNDALWTARHNYQTEVAQSPGATQTSLIGLAYLLVQELIKAGDFDKALEGIQKLSRLRGWDKSNEINIFAGITSADIETQRKQIEKELNGGQPTKSAESPLAN